MLDLGTSFLASVARDPEALALVDGDVRLSYAEWLKKISSLVAAFERMGLKPGDHLLTALQNNWQAATVHWACQLAGLIITPVNWRVNASELDFCIENSESRALVSQDVSESAVTASTRASDLIVMRAGATPAKDGELSLDTLCNEQATDVTARVSAESWSIMLYTSGTTSQPKGVPRRHCAERAAGIAHVAQNLYRRGERTLGVMPLYHTMGVRSLIAMSLIGGTFVCLPRFDAAHALALIAAEGITNLYLVPTLYYDLVHCDAFANADISSVRKLGFAGASMTDGLLRKLAETFRPDLFVNHYGSSEIYTFTIDQDAPAKPGSAGKAGINQQVKVVKLNATSVNEAADVGEEGEIVALLAGDESFEGYWRRPDADARALREGWYFTGDTGYVDRDRDLFVTGRVDDMIITGGENVSPVEIESCLSLHPAVLEVAVVGLADERWGKVVTAFVKRCKPVGEQDLDKFCRESGLADFKRPRRFVFVEAIPKSPVGKLLRRLLVAGEYQVEPMPPSNAAGSPFFTKQEEDMVSYEFADPRLSKLDGFQVEIDQARERADVILNRPPFNIVSMPQRDHLRLVFETLDQDDRVRIIVVRAIGEHFSSGGNIAGLMEATPETVSKLAWNIASPARCAKPVIVANRGYCFGVGFELSLACDFRIASDTAQYALPEQKLGQIPGSGGSARLQKMIGITRTKDIVMRSKRIPARQALEWGIVTECVADKDLEAATDKLVDELRTFAPLAQRTAKKLLNDTEDSTLAIATELEGHCYSRLRQSEDFREGVEAFNAKRTPKFVGR
jgi:2-furoate---CoA ligase